MMQTMSMGYKQTNIGIVPSDWGLFELNTICIKLNVGFVGVCEPFFVEEIRGVLLIRTGNLSGNNFILSGSRYVTKEFHKINKKSQVIAGDVMIARHGSSGNAVVVPDYIKEANTLNIVILRIDKKKASRKYTVYAINSTAVKNQVINSTAGSTQGVINTKSIAKLKIPFPPTLTEQTAIATALSDADALINSLEKLIAKKRNIKQGAVQQLLKPKKGWEVKKLGEIGKFTKGLGIRKDDAQSGRIPCIRYGELYTRHNDYVKQFHSFISKQISLTSKRLNKGDILFAGSGETKKEIGKCAAFISDVEAYAGGDIVILSPYNCSSLFLGFLLNTPIVQNQKASRGQGDAVVHISAKQLENISISVPNFADQTQIASILFDMDNEIITLESKLEKYRQIKSGMMQNLLTGKIRLL